MTMTGSASTGASENKYDTIYKYIIIGDMSVGKSCVSTRLTQNVFASDRMHTIGVEFATKIFQVTDQKIKFQIWDTAGQERFRAVTRSYYRGSQGIILIYDITRRSTFNHVKNWLADAKTLVHPYGVFMLIGNKSDLTKQREVSFEEANKYAEENGIDFFETSAKSGQNIEAAFMKSAIKIQQNMRDGRYEQSQPLGSASIGSGHVLVENILFQPAPKTRCSCSS